MLSLLRFLCLMSFVAVAAVGELLSVEIAVSGLNCASCANAVPRRLQRLRGVASAKFDPENGVAAVTLAEGNRVSLATLRDTLKNLGYTTGNTKISARGEALPDRKLRVLDEEFTLLDAKDMAGSRVRVEGTVAPGSMLLQVRSMTPD